MLSASRCSKAICVTNRSTNGKRVTGFGYGACGKGTAAGFPNGVGNVSVVDVDPVTTLDAHLDGFSMPLRHQAIAAADVIVTVTGFADIVTAADLPLMKHGVILMNGGHFRTEIDVKGIKAAAGLDAVDLYAAEAVGRTESKPCIRRTAGKSISLAAGIWRHWPVPARLETRLNRWIWALLCKPVV